MKISKIFNFLLIAAFLASVFYGVLWIYRWSEEVRVLRQVVQRLSSDSRIAEVLVTKSEFDEATKKIRTTIKFLEYDTAGRPLEPKYFTFEGDIIQFQALVIRFDDKFIRGGDKLRGKSAYLFLKAFVLEKDNTQVFNISEIRQIPAGYKIQGQNSRFEEELWRRFWDYALNPHKREKAGIKNAQIEAPGSLFRPGSIYTLKIEHDGGIRIDAEPIPEVLKGERL
ncbi:MAG: hypothetical protein HYZ83_02115 [Candidatus Omnitrophica bacterium]|nr:hypothetical protein [Candidatus Omnitrophota bacterium]